MIDHALCPVANRLWHAASARDDRWFARNLKHPETAQQRVLHQTLRQLVPTRRGEALRLDRVTGIESLAATAPPSGYDDLEPWVERVRRGEPRVLTADRVTHLVPTTGTTAACKLIPHTAGLQRQFNAAIRPWIVDLFRRHPGLRDGPAYWSISPAIDAPTRPGDRVPIGFDDDTAYLGRFTRRLAGSTLAVPQTVRGLRGINDFHHATLWWLLRARGLRLVSVWHPSFWTLLMGALAQRWDRLVRDACDGVCRGDDGRVLATGARLRATARRSLGAADPRALRTLWPALRVVSAWGDASSAGPFDALRRACPGVAVEAKGVLSTEAFLSIPYRGAHPLCVGSHVLELRDDDGRCVPAHRADVGGAYEPVVTTAGGLWRYATGDRVVVTGRLDATPTIRLLGRGSAVSDLCGEKLSEAQVLRALDDALASRPRPAFVMLTPNVDAAPGGYTLWASADDQDDAGDALAQAVDERLMQNPHFAWARTIGQLTPTVQRRAAPDAAERLLAHRSAVGQSMGGSKLSALGTHADHGVLAAHAHEPEAAP